MHAVVVRVTINDEAEADRRLREEVVPRVGVLDRSGDVWNLAVIAHAPR